MSNFTVRQCPNKLSRFEVLRDGVFVAEIEDTADETTLTADILTLPVLPPEFRVWHDRFPHIRACLDHLGVADFIPARALPALLSPTGQTVMPDDATDADLQEIGIDREKCELMTVAIMRVLISGANPREAISVLLSALANLMVQQTDTYDELETEMLPGLQETLADTVRTAWDYTVEAGIVRPEDNTGNPFQAPYVPPQHRSHAPGRA